MSSEGSFLYAIAMQFHHHPWNGLRFWDLIQPFFMSIVGVAMWFSVNKRLERGDSRRDITRHIIKRCVILLALGVSLHIGYKGHLVWELWNVLSQLSVTILIAYSIMKMKYRDQILISVGLLVITEILYRYTNIPGYDQPFVKDHNFGSFMDMILMGKINPGGGWVAINAIPTAAHTIWGVLAGKLLASSNSAGYKLKWLLIPGVTGLVVGYGLDMAGLDPIIKRICTASFVITSGGWFFLSLALFYWIIDILGIKGWVWFFVIVGMNPIFIYVFMETAGKQWLVGFSSYFVVDLLTLIKTPLTVAYFINALVVLLFAWYMCYWLYKRKIFIKI
jgi:predicted acyltransferase